MQKEDDPLFGMTSKEKRLRFKGAFTATGNSPNRQQRKAQEAGRSRFHHKGGENWRRNAQVWGSRYPKPRTLSVVNPRAVKLVLNRNGHLKKVPVPLTRLDKALKNIGKAKPHA